MIVLEVWDKIVLCDDPAVEIVIREVRHIPLNIELRREEIAVTAPHPLQDRYPADNEAHTYIKACSYI